MTNDNHFIMNKKCIFSKFLMFSMALYAISSCDPSAQDGDDGLMFPDGSVSYDDRLILGGTLTLRIYEKGLISPEIFVGGQKMDAEFKVTDDSSAESPVTEISIDFPEAVTDEMQPGIDGNICHIRLRTGIEGEEGIAEEIIAEVRLYEKISEFIEDITTGVPHTADIGGACCLYLDPEQEIEYSAHDGCYEIPMKIAGEVPVRLCFFDNDDNALRHVYMRQVMSISEDYVYAELEFPTSLDTLYTDFQTSVGKAYQSFGMEYRNVLMRVSDGKLLTMPENSYADGIEHYSHLSHCISDNEFFFSENITRNDGQMPRIRLYEINGDSINEIDQYHPGEYPEDAGSFYWTANENGIIISGSDYFSFEEMRLNGGLYYEKDDGQGHKYNEKLEYAYYILEPFVAADGKFYTVLGYRNYVTGTYYVTPRLYRMDKDAIFTPVTDLGEETENLVEHHAFNVTYNGNTYVFHDGGYCTIAADGEVVSESGGTEIRISGLSSKSKEYWPYNTAGFYYLPEDGSYYHVLSLENPASEAISLDVSSSYWYQDVMGDTAVFMEFNGAENSRCKIVTGNTVKYDLTLDRLDSSPGRSNWTVVGGSSIRQETALSMK